MSMPSPRCTPRRRPPSETNGSGASSRAQPQQRRTCSNMSVPALRSDSAFNETTMISPWALTKADVWPVARDLCAREQGEAGCGPGRPILIGVMRGGIQRYFGRAFICGASHQVSFLAPAASNHPSRETVLRNSPGDSSGSPVAESNLLHYIDIMRGRILT
jgi:hypothetical protein